MALGILGMIVLHFRMQGGNFMEHTYGKFDVFYIEICKRKILLNN